MSHKPTQLAFYKLSRRFYRRDDVVAIARELLGKVICTSIDGHETQAVITETEAYAGTQDRASHAFGGRRTQRTQPMFAPGGVAYVYLCYGIHHLLNVVTGEQDEPHAVLVRAGTPLVGIEQMLKRRGRDRVDRRLLGGPGSLAQALGITTALTGTDLSGDVLWIEDQGVHVPEDAVGTGPRVGIDHAGADASLPYRFVARIPDSELPIPSASR